MDAYIRRAKVGFTLAFILYSSVIGADDVFTLISDQAMKTQDQNAMSSIERQLKEQLPTEMAKHYQLIQLPREQNKRQ